LLPNNPKPEPLSNAQVNPAVVSGVDGSVAVPVKVTASPVNVVAGDPVSDVIVGATFVTFTVASATGLTTPAALHVRANVSRFRPLRRVFERTGLAAVVLAVALAGCGSSAKSRYVSKLNKMCEDFAKREQVIGTPGNTSELKSRGDRIVAAYEQSIAKPIERLQAPPEIADEAAELRRIVKQQLNALGALAQAGKAGDVAHVQRLATINQQLNAQAAQVARSLKADSCAS